MECESVSRIPWKCPVYSTLMKLQELFGDGFERFESLDGFKKASFVMGSEMWE